jgi:hypothetical protein
VSWSVYIDQTSGNWLADLYILGLPHDTIDPQLVIPRTSEALGNTSNLEAAGLKILRHSISRLRNMRRHILRFTPIIKHLVTILDQTVREERCRAWWMATINVHAVNPDGKDVAEEVATVCTVWKEHRALFG